MAGAGPRERDRRRFPALGIRNYRLFWIGGVLTNNGRWNQYVASYFVVYQLTESAAWVGMAGFSSFIPMLVTNPLAGYVSDRFDRRRVLLATNALNAAVAATLAVAWGSGVRSIGVWMALLLVGGTFYGIQLPTWQSFVAECVPRRHLRNAITLNSIQFNAARTVGPAVGGLLIGTFGPGWALAVAAASYGPVLVALLRIDPSALHRPGQAAAPSSGRASVVGEYRASIRYVRGKPGIRAAIITVALISTAGQPIVQQIVVFAEEVFEVSPFWFGMLGSAQGIGALISAPLVAGELSRLRRSRIQLFATTGYGLAIVLFALAPSFWLGYVGLGLIGAMHLTSATNLNSTVQLQVDDAFRGRVMAIYLMGVLGLAPFANLLMGWLISVFGPRPVVTMAGFLVIGGGLALQATGRYRRLDDS
ncbi:MAG: MFS transporter [Actinomycetota bacterium]|nr:MFS transporter [Acidimicrobiales bacterium]MED5396888.1 MFS transporter [Actinomycetota bacterium]MED5439163.1 MFS transporter [Actinomycetota bacterium]